MPGSDPQRPRHTNANRNEMGSFQPPDLRNLQTPATAVDASGRHTAGRTVRSRRTRRRLDGDASSSRQYPRHFERAWMKDSKVEDTGETARNVEPSLCVIPSRRTSPTARKVRENPEASQRLRPTYATFGHGSAGAFSISFSSVSSKVARRERPFSCSRSFSRRT